MDGLLAWTIVQQTKHCRYSIPEKVFLNRFIVNHGMLARLPFDRHCQGTTKFRQWTQCVITETMVWQGCPQMAIALNNICLTSNRDGHYLTIDQNTCLSIDIAAINTQLCPLIVIATINRLLGVFPQ